MPSRSGSRTERFNTASFYPPRPIQSRKGDFGKLIVAGGGDRYSGCLVFNALAALRTGVDLAIVVAPRRAADIVAGFSPDLITVPCSSAFPDPRMVKEVMSGADALLLGCGVIRTRAAHKALLEMMRNSQRPIVADAEALHALASKPNACQGKQVLLTPNAGEFQVLSGKRWPASKSERAREVLALARRFNATVIVKGADDYISDGARVYVDLQGSPYLTKGGYGDLLAGAAGALLARGHSPFDSAVAAAYLVGLAGKAASDALGEATLASDALAQLPFASGQSRGR